MRWGLGFYLLEYVTVAAQPPPFSKASCCGTNAKDGRWQGTYKRKNKLANRWTKLISIEDERKKKQRVNESVLSVFLAVVAVPSLILRDVG
jgi:hypothetical protein